MFSFYFPIAIEKESKIRGVTGNTEYLELFVRLDENLEKNFTVHVGFGSR